MCYIKLAVYCHFSFKRTLNPCVRIVSYSGLCGSYQCVFQSLHVHHRTLDRCRFDAVLSCNVRTSWVDNLCHYYDRSNPFVRPSGNRPGYPLPSHIQSHPLSSVQPSFPRPPALCPRTGRCHCCSACAIISSPDERGVLWRSRDKSLR